jgi:hypothetical protein
MSELLDEQRPPIFVQQLLVRRHLGGDRQCKQSHAVFDVGQLVVLESREVFPRVPSHQKFKSPDSTITIKFSLDGVESVVGFDELHEFLNANVELHGTLEFAQLALVVVAPGQTLGRLVLGETLLHLPRDEEHLQIGQLLQLGLAGQFEGGSVIASAQEVLDQHTVETTAPPQVQAGRLRSGILLEVLETLFAHVRRVQLLCDALLRL